MTNSQTMYRKRLKALMNLAENQVCSDCPERQPRWASLIVPPPGCPPGSLAIGAFCCLECSGSHRRLGVHISFVRSITLDQWKEQEVLAMENGGNAKVNRIFEARLDSNTIRNVKPSTHASGQVRERYIRDKYERRKYFDGSVLQKYFTGELGGQSDDDDSDDSDDEDSSESEDERKHAKKGGSKTSTVAPVTIRAPSEAARLRAQKVRQQRGARKSNSALPPPLSAANFRSTKSRRPVAAPAPPPPPEVDLLDFGSLTTGNGSGSGPPPNPPSAAPSPTLDMFRDVKPFSNYSNSALTSGSPTAKTGTSNFHVTTTTESSTQNTYQQKQADILAMFDTPSTSSSANNNMNNNFGNFSGTNNGGNMAMNAVGGFMYGNNNTMMPNNMLGDYGHPNMMMMMNQQMTQNMNKNIGMGMPAMKNATMSSTNTTASHGIQSKTMHTQNTPFQQENNGAISNTITFQQNQDPMMLLQNSAPMGGTPVNLNVMGGVGDPTGVHNQNYGNTPIGSTENGTDINGFSKWNVNSSSHANISVNHGQPVKSPQADQFAEFGAFR